MSESKVAVTRISTRSIVICVLGVMLIAALLRVGFATTVVRSLTPDAFRDVHGDTNGYVRLAQRLLDGETYTVTGGGNNKDDELSKTRNFNLHRGRLRALARPPGYPVYLALHEWIGRFPLQADLRPLVWSQVLLSIFTVGMLAYLGCHILGHVAAGWVAGVLGALSPTAIASAVVMTPDSIYATFCLAGFGAFILMTRPTLSTRSRILCAAVAGLAFTLAVALKPAISYWPVLAIPVYVIVRGFRLATFRDLAIAFIPMFLFVGAWTAHNYHREGIATYSIIATRNLYYDVAIRAKLAEQLGAVPNDRKYRQAAKKVVDRDNAILREGDPDLIGLDRSMRDEIRATLKGWPRGSAKVLFSNLWDQTSTGWLWAEKQVPATVRGASLTHRVFRTTSRDGPLFLWFAGIAAALPICWLRRDRKALVPLTLCLLGALYVAAGVATIHGEGSRLMTAAEPLCLLLITATVCHLADVTRSIITKSRSKPA